MTDRPYRVVFQRYTVIGEDVYGGEIKDWAAYATEYADVRFSKGSERRAAAQEQAAAVATFIVLANAKTRTLSVTDRIMFDGTIWDIVSAIPSREFNAMREIEATRPLA